MANLNFRWVFGFLDESHDLSKTKLTSRDGRPVNGNLV